MRTLIPTLVKQHKLDEIHYILVHSYDEEYEKWEDDPMNDTTCKTRNSIDRAKVSLIRTDTKWVAYADIEYIDLITKAQANELWTKLAGCKSLKQVESTIKYYKKLWKGNI